MAGPEGPWRRRLAVAAGVAMALALGWPAVRWALADWSVAAGSERALDWQASHARGLLEAADRALRSGQPGEAEALARRYIAARPLEGNGYRLLAVTFEQRGRTAEQAAAIAAALAVSPNDLIARRWMAARELAAGRYAEGLVHVDRVLRLDPDNARQTFAFIEPGLSDPVFREHLLDLLLQDPPWRGAFVSHLLRHSRDRSQAGWWIESLWDASALPEAEVKAWLESLERARDWEGLRAAWVRHSRRAPEEAALVEDGGFERPPAGFGLGWRIGRVAGASILFAPARGSGHGGRALTLLFDDRRVDFRHVSQLLLLGPGRYQITGEHRSDQLRTTRGLRWRLRCLPGRDAAIMEGPVLRGTHRWTTWEQTFEVPADCPAQELRLELDAVGPSEQWIGGEAAVDGLSIRALAPMP